MTYKNIQDFKTERYFFNLKEYGRIYIFIDFGNVRSWAKDLWKEENKYRIFIEIDIEKLSRICDWVNPERKFFYYGYFPKRNDLSEDHKLNIKYRKSIFRIDRARKSGFQVKTKEIKMISLYNEDGKHMGKISKCNFDVEITMDMLQKIEKYDSLMLFSGDSDFTKLLEYVKSKNKKIITVCTRNCMSMELDEISDKFIPAESLRSFLEYESKKITPPRRAEE
jgi:uncharacterized LabA/DUF88 family protein